MHEALLASSLDAWSGSRRPMDVDDYLAILKRNTGWIAGPLLAGLAAAMITAFLWPDTFVSRASIRIVPPQVPEQLVPTNLNVRMDERVRTMAQTILSRNSLINIIETHNLYRRKRKRMPLEDVVEDMQKDIQIGGLRAVPGQERTAAFEIAFSYDDRHVAQKVTRDLLTRFMDENTRSRSQQSRMTTRFLEDQLDASRNDLDALESRLAEFRRVNLGRLPEQLNSNMQQITILEARVSVLNSSVNRANQDKIVLESELRGLRDKENAIQRATREAGQGSGLSDPVLVQLDGEIRGLRSSLDQLLEVYRPTYPDVQRMRSRLDALERQRDAHVRAQESWKDEDGAEEAAPVTAEQRGELIDIRTSLQRTQGQISARELEIERALRDIAESEAKLREAQIRIEAGPANLQVYEQLTRDLNIAKARYEDLDRKVSQSAIATEVETNQQGETLEVLDLPSLPETPTEPNRPLIVGIGAALGLVLGLALIGFREMKDTSLKSLKDVRAYTNFAVLGSVPLLENDLVIRRRRRAAWVAWAAVLAMNVAFVATSVFYYYSKKA